MSAQLWKSPHATFDGTSAATFDEADGVLPLDDGRAVSSLEPTVLTPASAASLLGVPPQATKLVKHWMTAKEA